VNAFGNIYVNSIFIIQNNNNLNSYLCTEPSNINIINKFNTNIEESISIKKLRDNKILDRNGKIVVGVYICFYNKIKENDSNVNPNDPFNILCKRKFDNSIKDILDKLIEKGANVNFKGEFGITPMMMACYFNNEELVSYLITKNADLNITNMDNDTPLTIASYFNNKNIVNLLVNNDSKNLKNKYNETALTIANKLDNKEIKEILEYIYSVDGEEEIDKIDDTSSDEDSNVEIIEQNYIRNSELINRDLINKLTEIADKSVCLIKVIDNNVPKSGTGFLVKLPIPSKEEPLYGLITNNHLLVAECLQPDKSFEIIINKKSLKINLNNNNFIFTSELIDITFIQLTDEIFFNNPDIEFLNPNVDKNKTYINKPISIVQYPFQEQSFAFGRIRSLSGFNYFHSVTTDEGSSGSPLLNNDLGNLKIIGVHKICIDSNNPSKIKNVATKFSIVEDVISILHQNMDIYDVKKAREKPRILDADEINELEKHGLKKTKLYNVFKCPCLIPNKKLVALYYKTNHGWYCTLKNENKIEYKEKNLKIFDWTYINPFEPIEKIIEEIVNNTGKGKLEHRQEIIIMWLKLSEFKYI